MSKPAKSFTKEQRDEYEQLMFAANLNFEGARKWADALATIKSKEYFLIDAPSWDQWLEQACEKYQWTNKSLVAAVRREQGRSLIVNTTAEPIIKETSKERFDSVASRPEPTNTEHKDNKPSARAAAPAKVLDVTGREVHHTILDTWNRRNDLDYLARQLSEIKCLIEEQWEKKDPIFEQIHSDILIKLKTAHYYITGAKLEYVCGFCQGKCKILEQHCANCHGLGLMTKFQWERTVPEQLKRGLKQ